jgi:hypothetical protein
MIQKEISVKIESGRWGGRPKEQRKEIKGRKEEGVERTKLGGM